MRSEERRRFPVRTLLEPVLELLAPAFCRACGREGLEGNIAYCRECRRTIRWITSACSACGHACGPEPCRSDGAEAVPICGECIGRRFGFDRAATAAIYDGVVRSAVLAYKFRVDLGVRPFLVQVALEALRRPWMREVLRHAEALVPIPQHWTRTLRRGWNPVAELAEALAASPGFERRLPVCPLLRKTRRTAPQVVLSGKVRRRNLRRAFAVRRGSGLPSSVLLIDDVLTTGTTASECARALKGAGVDSVALLTVARSPTEL